MSGRWRCSTAREPDWGDVAEPLTRDKILEAAEQVLRRFGPAKTTVVDVARALGVSHGSVYRHFASKSELLDAVVEAWLKRTSGSLEDVAKGDLDGPSAGYGSYSDIGEQLEQHARGKQLSIEGQVTICVFFRQDLSLQLWGHPHSCG